MGAGSMASTTAKTQPPMTRKPKIALIKGGYTEEAAVSYKSAATVKKNIDPTKFDVYEIHIGSDGWYCSEGEVSHKHIIVDRNDFSLTINNKKIKFDCVFMCLHGSPGEDGKLEGYFDMLKIPYTGCSNATSSAVTMNKQFTIAIAGFHGINVAKSVLIRKSAADSDGSLEALQLPVYVKPNNGGSSIDTSRVDKSSDLEAAIRKAFRNDTEVIVEEEIPGREFTVGVFHLLGTIGTLPITEIKTQSAVFSYDEKYNRDVQKEAGVEEITPAALDEALEDEIKRTAIKIYKILGCSWIIRIDFKLNRKDNKLYLLEVNTVPGETGTSFIPQQVKKMGWTLSDLFTASIEEALNLPATVQLRTHV